MSQPNDPNSIVDYLKSRGLPSDMAARNRLALDYGIINYTGTAEQNIKLLALLRNPPALGFFGWLKTMLFR